MRSYFQTELLLKPTCKDLYLLLTEFEGRTANYGPRFSHSIYGPSALRSGHKSKGKTRVRNLQYGLRNKVSKIFIISLYIEIESAKNKVLDLVGRTVEYGPLN